MPRPEVLADWPKTPVVVPVEAEAVPYMPMPEVLSDRP